MPFQAGFNKDEEGWVEHFSPPLQREILISHWHYPKVLDKVKTKLNITKEVTLSDRRYLVFSGTFDDFTKLWEDKFLSIYNEDEELNNYNPNIIFVTDKGHFGMC